MSNWSPKILWPIDYSSMTSITHRCNSLLINYCTVHERHLYHFVLFVILLSMFVILLSMLEAFFLVSEVPVDDSSANYKYRWSSIVQFAKLNNLEGATFKVWFKEILENLLKLNFHVLLIKLKRINLETSVHIWVVLILFFVAKHVFSHEMISMGNGWNQWLINAIND